MIRPHAAYPYLALLNRTARLSDQRNETTTEYRTPEGQPVAVSFWLADPPGAGYLSVHRPLPRPRYITVDQSYSGLLPELVDEETQHSS
jgi:hypothetical protein